MKTARFSMRTLTITTLTILQISVMLCYAEDRYEVGEYGQYITTADFNNDGYIDFCVDIRNENLISVLLNNGDGTFAPPVSYPTDYYPGKIAAADIDNDGWFDMIITHPQGPFVMHIYFNKGDGTFKEPTIYDFTSIGITTFQPLTVADINNDGWFDILLSGVQSEKLLVVMINNGDGTFPEPLSFGVGILPGDSPQVVDVNNDGFLDVFVVSKKSYFEEVGIIAFFKNKGNGTFNEPVSYETPSTYSRLTLVDVDNDGFTDVLCNNPKTNNISILYNNKDGTFADPINIDAGGTYPLKITPADVDNNGWIDLLVSNLNSQNLSIFLNNGDGNFKNPFTYITGVRPRQVVASDLNNDGWIDMAVTCWSSYLYDPPTNDIWIYLNNGDGTFTESGRYGRGSLFLDKAETVDVDNDGLLDIIQSDQGYHKVNCSISIFRNIGGGKFDNSGIDLRHDPDSAISTGGNVKIIVNFRTFPRSVNADLYFVMLNPQGIIYSGFAWYEGIAPAFMDLPLPPNTNLFDLTLLEFAIPSAKPPVSALGSYIFAMGLFKPGTAEMITNLTTTTLEVVE